MCYVNKIIMATETKRISHRVIDLVYHEDEGNSVFVGTLKECNDYVSLQSDFWTYQIIPLTKEEIENYMDVINSYCK